MAVREGDFGDREILEDLLAAQQETAVLYARWACQCGSDLSAVLLVLLGEERQLCVDLMTELRNRNWQTWQPADKQEIQDLREEFSREK